MSIGMMLLIVLATVCFVLESETLVEDGLLYNTSAPVVFVQIELVSVIIFTAEYVIRITCCPFQRGWGIVKFICDPSNIIDLLACAPYWITQIIVALNPGVSTSGFAFVRVIRLVRVFRVVKVSKYSSGIQMIVGSITRSSQPLLILAFSLSLAVVILSSIMHMVEGYVANTIDGVSISPGNEVLLSAAGFDAAGHLYCFGTIPRCFWWAFITMTTVGYGDCYPITVGGKLLAMATSVLGVLILALPITVVGSNFQKMVEMYDEESSTMREFDISEDGNIDIHELRAFLVAKKKDHVLRKDVDLNPARLMSKYDDQDNGSLSFEEFAALKREIMDPMAMDPQANMRIILTRVNDNERSVDEIRRQLLRIERLLEASMGKEGQGAAEEEEYARVRTAEAPWAAEAESVKASAAAASPAPSPPPGRLPPLSSNSPLSASPANLAEMPPTPGPT